MDGKVNLAVAVRGNFDFEPTMELPRFRLKGWFLQGTGPVKCSKCTTAYEIFRCPYTTTKGEYKYWAMVCVGCKKVTTLDKISGVDKKSLEKWNERSLKVGSGSNTKSVPRTDVKNRPSPVAPPQAKQTTPSSKFEPTVEQLQIIEAVAGGGDIAVNALAGTGKTTTLRLISQSIAPKRGCYIAFNKAIVDEARSKFPKNVNCLTAHGLAFKSTGHLYQHRLSSRRVQWKDLADYFDALDFQFKSTSGPYGFSSSQIAKFASDTVSRFCKSTSEKIGREHVPKIPLIKVSDEIHEEFSIRVRDIAISMWKDLLAQSGYMKFEHDHYLKIWQLSKPTINADIILFDEAQDADPVMLDVVNSQQSQLVYCGDTFQSIYEWRGAKDALSLVHVDKRFWLTQSFRFGPEIAEIGNQILRRMDSPKEIIGLKTVNSEIVLLENPDAILCRTNYGAITSLREAQLLGRKAALMGNVKETLKIFTESCVRLINGQRNNHPELGVFQTWREALMWARDDSEVASDTAMLIRLVESIGANEMLDILGSTVDEKVAEVVITTVHKAKGREWNTVSLAGDFKHPDDMDPEELKLLYVAVTRAKEKLDISQLPEKSGDKPILFRGSIRNNDKGNVSKVKKSRPPIEIVAGTPFIAELGGGVPAIKEMRVSKSSSRSTSSTSKETLKTGNGVIQTVNYDNELFETLKEWRQVVAKKNGWPAYTVLNDATLKEIASVKPRTINELRKIKGIGPTKLELYSDAVLGMIESTL